MSHVHMQSHSQQHEAHSPDPLIPSIHSPSSSSTLMTQRIDEATSMPMFANPPQQQQHAPGYHHASTGIHDSLQQHQQEQEQQQQQISFSSYPPQPQSHSQAMFHHSLQQPFATHPPEPSYPSSSMPMPMMQQQEYMQILMQQRQEQQPLRCITCKAPYDVNGRYMPFCSAPCVSSFRDEQDQLHQQLGKAQGKRTKKKLAAAPTKTELAWTSTTSITSTLAAESTTSTKRKRPASKKKSQSIDDATLGSRAAAASLPSTEAPRRATIGAVTTSVLSPRAAKSFASPVVMGTVMKEGISIASATSSPATSAALFSPRPEPQQLMHQPVGGPIYQISTSVTTATVGPSEMLQHWENQPMSDAGGLEPHLQHFPPQQQQYSHQHQHQQQAMHSSKWLPPGVVQGDWPQVAPYQLSPVLQGMSGSYNSPPQRAMQYAGHQQHQQHPSSGGFMYHDPSPEPMPTSAVAAAASSSLPHHQQQQQLPQLPSYGFGSMTLHKSMIDVPFARPLIAVNRPHELSAPNSRRSSISHSMSEEEHSVHQREEEHMTSAEQTPAHSSLNTAVTSAATTPRSLTVHGYTSSSAAPSVPTTPMRQFFPFHHPNPLMTVTMVPSPRTESKLQLASRAHQEATLKLKREQSEEEGDFEDSDEVTPEGDRSDPTQMQRNRRKKMRKKQKVPAAEEEASAASTLQQVSQVSRAGRRSTAPPIFGEGRDSLAHAARTPRCERAGSTGSSEDDQSAVEEDEGPRDKVCELCKKMHTGKYGGGRFCGAHCARHYSIVHRWAKKMQGGGD